MPDDSAATINIAFYLLFGALVWTWLVFILRGPGDEH